MQDQGPNSSKNNNDNLIYLLKFENKYYNKMSSEAIENVIFFYYFSLDSPYYMISLYKKIALILYEFEKILKICYPYIC